MLAARPHRTRMIARPRTAPGPGTRLGEVIPYDYGAVFPITGRPGNVVQSVINTAPDSVFVAVAIGYGFEEDRGRALSFVPAKQNGVDPPPDGTVRPGNITLDELPASALIQGFRVNPRSENLVFREDDRRGREFTDAPLPAVLVRNGTLFQRVRAPAEISFLFSILDSGTGRELQDEPIHNIASLGKSNGETAIPAPGAADHVSPALHDSPSNPRALAGSAGQFVRRFLRIPGRRLIGLSRAGRAQTHRFADVPDGNHRQPFGARDPI